MGEPAGIARLRELLSQQIVPDQELRTAELTLRALVLALRTGRDFMPELDEGALILNTIVPAEASLEQGDLLNHRVEGVLRTFPEVTDVVRRTGRSERTEDPMAHTYSDVLVVLDPERARLARQRRRSARAPGQGAGSAYGLLRRRRRPRRERGARQRGAVLGHRAFFAMRVRAAVLGARLRGGRAGPSRDLTGRFRRAPRSAACSSRCRS